MASTLTLKQQKFVAAYIGEARGNGTAAARLAGYAGNDHVLAETARDNLLKPVIAQAVAEYRAAVREEGAAVREERIRAQDDRWRRMLAVIDARAQAHIGDAPGAETGLLVRTYKQVGQGRAMRLVEEWAVDTGLLGELRQLEQHTAKELGQWVDKAAPTDPTGEHPYDAVGDDDLRREIRALLAGREGTGGDGGADPA